jgi:NADPH:quinone reductase-like Zn-dependent oxidoreductase
VLIRTIATSINPVDEKTRSGAFDLLLPATIGWDLAGVVVDPGDSELGTGDRVMAMSHQLSTQRGTWADLVALPSGIVAPAPSSVSILETATLPLPGLTALQTLDWLGLSRGERLLVAGAAGAVGSLAVQIARARGVVVDALVSRDAHLDVVKEYGADTVTTDPTTLTKRSYDAVLDTFGAFAAESVPAAVADGGRYASIATQAGPVPDLSNRDIRTTINQVHEDGAGLRTLGELVEQRLVVPSLDSIHHLHDLAAAHHRAAHRGLLGKVGVVF